MTQYIDKSAVVAEIERRRKLVSDPILSGDDLMIGERNALFNLLSFINTLEVKEVDSDKCEDSYEQGYADAHPHWISVKDKLPEACGAVLTTTQKGTQRVGCYEDGWWLANFPDLVRMGSITHWMPLPAAPQKGGEEC